MLKRLARFIQGYEWSAVAVEILVIIVGLMLALQLDRWREDRAELGQEQAYVERLIADVGDDIPAIEYAIELQTLRLELIDLLMQVARTPERAADDPVLFLGAVSQAAFTYTPALTSHTFENLRATGDMRLIRDQAVKDSLFDYYGFDEEQRQYRPLQFQTEHRHFELAAGVLGPEQETYMQDTWLFFRPDNIAAAREARPPAAADVTAAAQRLQERHELVAWLPYVRSMQLEQISVHGMRLERARATLEKLQAYAAAIGNQ